LILGKDPIYYAQSKLLQQQALANRVLYLECLGIVLYRGLPRR
jgi:hypothetical protein